MNIGLNLFPGGKSKALTMSYDDGNVADRRLVEVFNQFGIKGTFHLNSGKFGKENYIEATEVASLFRGHEVSVHTVNHPHLEYIPSESIAEEILEDRKNLENLTGYPVTGMSYPFGTYNSTVLQMLPFLGIEYSRTVKSHGQFSLPEDFLQWHPTCHHKDNIQELGQQFLERDPRGTMSLFYVWGHSYEFDRNNNWNIIEDFCKLMRGYDTIWYATNIEICHYLKAVKSLIFSADKTMVHNPSALSVWISVEGKALEIGAGEIKKLTI